MSTMLEILAKVEEFPTIPDVAVRISRHLANPDCDLGEATKMISLDASLASRVIRMANSPIFGATIPTDSLNSALVRLGTRETRNVVLTIGVIDALPSLPEPFDPRSFWTLGLATALFARQLALDLDYPDPEQAYLAGLVHDLGEGVLAIATPERFRRAAEKAARHRCPIEEALTNEFGFSHPELCARVLDEWNFSGSTVEAVRFHLDPIKAPLEPFLASIIFTADRLARDLGLGFDTAKGEDRAWIQEVPPDITERIEALGYPDLTFYLMERREFLDDIKDFVNFVFRGS